MSFASLKQNDLSKLTKALEELSRSSESSNDDDRLWYPAVDKAGNGYSVIRFLPTPEVDGQDGLPWVRKFSHAFQGPGGWYIEDCPTTINKDCPVCKHNNALWNSGLEANKDLVRKQKRKLTYISNIYVVTDPANPENNKKVKLYKFGKKIFDKINEAMNPQFQDEQAWNPFHLYEGANLKLKIRNVEEYRNYDKSEFDTCGPLLSDDAALEKIWKSEHSLTEFVNPKIFKEYEVLQKKLEKVLGQPTPKMTDTPKPAPVKAVTKPTIEDDLLPKKAAATEEDDDLSYFQKLADEE